MNEGQHINKRACPFESPILDVKTRKLRRHQKRFHIRRRRDAISQTKFVELAIVSDKTSFDLFNGSLTAVENHAMQVSAHDS